MIGVVAVLVLAATGFGSYHRCRCVPTASWWSLTVVDGGSAEGLATVLATVLAIVPAWPG
jgi:hypothetical protein